MKQRVITGAILIAILLPIFTVSIFFEVFEVFMTVFVIVAAFELIKMYEKEKPFNPIAKYGIVLLTLATFISMSSVFQSTDNPLVKGDVLTIMIPIITLVLFGFMALLKDFNGVDVGKALTVVNYVGLGSAAIVILRMIGVRFIVYLFLITMLTDTFAYLIGSKYGQHKMAPHISPKKSWEGAIGGALIATVLASLFAIFYGYVFVPGTALGDLFNATGERTLLDNFSSLGDGIPLWVQSLVLVPITFVASLLAQTGDLVASRLKRTYDIKDFGNILPGHGGLLDRFDSVLFVAMFLVAVFLVIQQVYPLYGI